MKANEKTPALPEIVKKTIAMAIAKLDACGCKYAVVDGDGTVYGDLPIDTKAQKRHRGTPRNDFTSIGYPAMVEAAKVGDVVEVRVPDDYSNQSMISLRGAISSKGINVWGKGNATSAIVVKGEDQYIQVMRTG